jgi:hypothetical protein
MDRKPSLDSTDATQDTQQHVLALVKSATSQRSIDFKINKAIPSDIFEVDAPISTPESDELALQRLAALKTTCKEPDLPPRPLVKQSLSRRLLNKTKISKSLAKTVESEVAPSEKRQFSLRLLSLALHDAVVEGNVQLVASIFKLGANTNFNSLEPASRHHVLKAAVLSGHTHMVNYLTVMGADEVSIGHALISALRADNLDMAVRLLPHANMVSLHPWDNLPRQCQVYVTLFGRIALDLDTIIPPETIGRALEIIINDARFSATSMVYEYHETVEVAGSSVRSKETKPLLSYNAVQLLISLVDNKVLETLLSTLSIDLRDQRFRGWVIPAEQWGRHHERALETLRLLISHSAFVDHAAESESRKAMTPLAHAVAGGSADAVTLLLEHNADPECLVYELIKDRKRDMVAYTAMGWSAKQGRVDIGRQLISAGAIPWRTDASNCTPLFWASANGHFEVVEYLLSLDIKRSAIDECLIAAVVGNYPQIVKVLLENGAAVKAETVSIQRQPQKSPEV